MNKLYQVFMKDGCSLEKRMTEKLFNDCLLDPDEMMVEELTEEIKNAGKEVDLVFVSDFYEEGE